MLIGESAQLMHQPFRVHPAQRVPGDVELPRVIAQHDGPGQKIVCPDAAPQRTFGGDQDRIRRDDAVLAWRRLQKSKVTSAAAFVTYWDKDAQLKGLWLTIFFLLPIGVNFLYVRRLGEIEYWFTTAKIILILIVIVTGILIAMGLSTNPLLGTSSQYQPVPCSANEIGPCLPGPGLVSIVSLEYKD